MSKTTYYLRREVIEKLSTDPLLRGDSLGFALQKIGETSADILQVEDVSFWQISSIGEHLICIAAHNNANGPSKTVMRVPISEIKEYIPAMQENLYLALSDLSTNTNINRLVRKFLGEDDDVGACLHVPFYINGAFNGVVQFNQSTNPRTWSLSDRVFACQIADLATDTIRHTVMSVDERYIPDTLDLLGNTLDNLLDALELTDGMVRLDEISLTRGYKPEVALSFANLYQSSPFVRDKTLVIQDINITNDNAHQLVEVLKDEEARSVIVAPMLVNGERVGCILVSSPVVMDWKPEEIEMVTRTARYAARFVQDIWAHQDVSGLSSLIQRFQDSSQKLNHMMMFEDSIQEVGRSAADVLETSMAFIALRNPDNIIESPWVSGLNNKMINQIITIESESIQTILRNNKQPVLFPDVNKSILPDSLQRYLMEKDIQAARIFPLVYEGQTLGAVFGFYKHARLYTRNERSVLSLFANAATLTLQNAWMYNQVEQGYLNLALELANSVDSREIAHADVRWKLAELAEKTALRLKVPERELTAIHWAALLHDIGKHNVPEEVLQKSGPLNEEEWKLLQHTPVRAEKLLKPIPQLREVAKVVRNYRERFDGSGYPDHLKGDQIPVGAKVLAVVDAYTSMLTDRPYQKLRRPQEALDEIQRFSGTQFDPVVVNAFSQVVARAQ
jgi:HD-GYP domain-containing protein (c-di-GMP phosphodiesterase class II)